MRDIFKIQGMITDTEGHRIHFDKSHVISMELHIGKDLYRAGKPK